MNCVCGHPEHDGRCDYPITQETRDDVGIFAPPTGIVRNDIVKTCGCETFEPDDGTDGPRYLPNSTLLANVYPGLM